MTSKSRLGVIQGRMLVENRDFLAHMLSTPPAPVIGVGIFPWELVRKTRMVWLPDCEKKIENMFTRFDTIRERDRHPDERTGERTPHDGIGRAYA